MPDKPESNDKDEFLAAMRGVRRLKTDKIEPTITRKKLHPRSKLLRVRKPIEDDIPLTDHESTIVSAEEPLSFIRPGLQPRYYRSLKNGHIPVEAELDLHGSTVEKAREKLLKFLPICYKRGIRVIRIIHGKGHRGSEMYPILKNKVNAWLPQFDFVLAFCSCLPNDGGNGAVYALLKRQREE